jgi:soluble lytic murein transglycosylase-like protein
MVTAGIQPGDIVINFWKHHKNIIWWVLGALFIFIVFLDIQSKHQVNELKAVIRDSTAIEIQDSLIKVFKVDRDRAPTLAFNIKSCSKQFGVSWKKIAAKIRVESNFNPLVKSKSTKIGNDKTEQRAYGLLQIKPATGKEWAEDLNIEYDSCYLYNEYYSVYLGTYGFAKMEVPFSKSFEKAEKAYNVGLAGYYAGLASEQHWLRIDYWHKRLQGINDTILFNKAYPPAVKDTTK